jgi:hypothetical protein
MKIGLVGGSYQQSSLPFDAQRSVNLFPVLDEQGKEVAALYGTPGLSLFGTAGTGPIRGCFFASNGRGFVVSGSTLYEISGAGVATSRGTLLQSSGIVSIAENGLQLAICDGVTVYILTYGTNVFAKVADVDLPVSGTITFLDGYFIVNQVGSGKFYISGLYDGTSWTALGFATAESSPDTLLRVYNALGQLWLLGDTTTEIWTTTTTTFPFQRIAGGKLTVGILAPHTAVEVDNALFWLGKDQFGKGIVYRSQSVAPQRISTEPIELLIQAATDLTNIRAFVYQQQGHVFYVLTGGGLETSLVYDLTTQIWHERAYLNTDGNYEQHRASCAMAAFGVILVGDRENGNIYTLSMDVYDDDGDAILRERIYTHLSDEGKRIRYNSLEIGFETGVGLQSGQGSNPLVSLQLSKDGARTWSDTYTASIGAVGKYMTKVMFRRLGIAEQMTFRIKISDPVKVAIVGSYLQ